jgi:argininosuccinate lyase
MKLWEKGIEVDKLVEQFTVGKDREMDLYIAEFDVLGTIAHITMLNKIGLLSSDELKSLIVALREIYTSIKSGTFVVEEGVEDVHSEVEGLLTQKLGESGKRIHSGRSRNDQVLVDIKLFIRQELRDIVCDVNALFSVLIEQSEKYRHVLIPGYTHLQVAMPSSFGLWFGAYAESLTDDMLMLQAAYKINNQNPLGSAAGYGSSFPLDRTLTTKLMGFDDLNYNVVYAQMTRSKNERSVAAALASVAFTLAKMAADSCLFMSQNFGFISLPDNLTTGSSIMPHKKNPDVFELVRARCNKIQALVYDISMITTNMPSGYFRDYQVLKEILFPAFGELRLSLKIMAYMVENIGINEHVLDDPKYRYLFSVETVNQMVLEGTPFREAYRKVADEIKDGTYEASGIVNHTHEGSIGNLCNDQIKRKMDNLITSFHFELVEAALVKLLDGDMHQ